MQLKQIKKRLKKVISPLLASDVKGKTARTITTINEEELVELKAEEERRRIEVQDREDLAELKKAFNGYDRDHVWAFISGHESQDFRGNPKYMFAYINRYRSDIRAYWFCSNEETIDQVRRLGFRAYRESSLAMQYAIDHTGVIVVEQVKYGLPEGFSNVKYLNLWHGVGFKQVERKLYFGDISMNLARKYIKRGTFFRDHQLFNATCPIVEEEITGDCGVDYDMVLRTGYPRCLYQKYFDPVVSFDHDLRKQKGLPEDTKLAVFAPTFRARLGGTFTKALPDLEALYHICEKKHILMIFKVHPAMENEVGFLDAWRTYGDRPYFWFWDNQDDFYEIMDQMDLAIVDYTSLISDMIAVGIKHYIRYVFDFDEYMAEYSEHNHYLEMSTGVLCYTFEEMLLSIDTFEGRDETEEIERLNQLLWSYSEGKDDLERIIQATFDFRPKQRTFPRLYSFDIFDTLFSRKVLDPVGIFYRVQERIAEHGGFPFELATNYPKIRNFSEQNTREYYRKSIDLRQSDRVEITFDEIFLRMQEVYALDEEQITLLKQWEIEAELDNVIPLNKQITKVKQLLAAEETVVLISDMYLPEIIIKKMLAKADPVLAEIPLFLSSEYGVMKTSQKLFFEVYKSFEPYYDFEKWIHYGDNINADQTQPRRFQISTRKVEKPSFNDYQQYLVERVATYDSYLVAALQARMRNETIFYHDEFVISYIALCFVPYVDWVLRDAQRRGYKTLYFVSRDGYHLKRIADAIIEQRGLDFKTKYIYASRRTWRIPSFINEVEDGFWQGYGSFTDIVSKEKLLRAMELDEETFRKFFPSIEIDTIDYLNLDEIENLIEIFKESAEYNEYLLQFAAKKRILVNRYLKQEIDPKESFAFVEYNGRGYTQDCMVKLWRNIMENENVEVPYYYSRSILPSMNGSVRHDFTTQIGRQYFLEAIFANMPYKSIEDYQEVDGHIEPIIQLISYDEKLFESMQRILPEFARRYATLELRHPEATDRMMYDFIHEYYQDNIAMPDFAERIGSLVDSVTLYGEKREYAPPYTKELLDTFRTKELRRDSTKVTWSMSMSAARTKPEILEEYKEMYQILPGDKLYDGRLLSDEEIELNRSYKEKFEAISEIASDWKKRYERCVREHSVRNEVVFVVNGKEMKSEVMIRVYQALKEQTDFELKTISVGKLSNDLAVDELINAISSAKIIILNQAINQFAKIVFRKATTVILLRSDPFNLYHKAGSSKYNLKWRQRYITMVDINDIDVLQVPSEEQQGRFLENFSTLGTADTSLKGACITDIYFENNRDDFRRMLDEKFPEATGKKVILYMPDLRMRNNCETWAAILDMELLQKSIGNEYVVVCNYNKDQYANGYENVKELSGFCKFLFSSQMNLRKLMIASDIIIGDYRDTFFESALLHKPTFSTAFNYENRMKDAAMFAEDFEEYLFCPVIKDAVDLIEQLNNLDSYDYGPMEEFRERKFGWCQGHSVQNVVDYVLKKMGDI